MVAAQRLAELYPRPTIPLTHRDPFTLLVAVILSAQCTDVRVNQVTPRDYLRWRTRRTENGGAHCGCKSTQFVRPCGLSSGEGEEIYAKWRDNYWRSTTDRLPRTFAELEELAVSGPKQTASVLMVQAFNHPAFPVDTHIHRLAMRWKLSRGPGVVQVERDLKKLFPPEDWHDLHLRIIYYGREHCTARGCDGHSCEICQKLNGPLSVVHPCAHRGALLVLER